MRVNEPHRPILLLGAGGQVGTELRSELARLGPLVAYARQDLDITEIRRVRDVVRDLKPALVVNAAAYTAVDKAEQESDKAFAVNGAAVGELAAAAGAVDAILVHYSTDYVFDGKGSAPYPESAATRPLSVYGKSKLAGEQSIVASGARALILRTSWLFGAVGGNFVKTILRLASTRTELQVVDDQIGQPTPADLLAHVTARLAAQAHKGDLQLRGAKIYHVTSRGEISWHGFAKAIVAAAIRNGHQLRLTADAVKPIPSAEYPLPAPRPVNSRLALENVEAQLGQAMPHWQHGLEKLLKGLKIESC